MTGPEHYCEAERLIAYATDGDETYGSNDAEEARIRSDARELAQVHATLAGAAATALQMVLPLVGDDQQVTDWAKAIGVSADTSQVDRSRVDNAIGLVDEWQRKGIVTPDDAAEMYKALGEVTR